jgi:drug/metabolite transporter (DMT)-like permease
VLGYLFLCLCWSTTWQAIRYCLEGYPPQLGAALRFGLAALMLAGVLLIRRTTLGLPGGRRQHLALAVSGLVNGLGYACVYVAEQTLTGGTTAVICASSPLFTLLLARLFGLEPLLPQRLVGMAMGLGGVAVLFADGLMIGRGHFQSMVLAGLAAALLWPLYGALLKRSAQDLPPLVTTCYFLFYTAVMLVALSILRGEPWPDLHSAPWRAHAGLLYLTVVGSVLAWSVYLWLLQRLELSVLSTIGLVQPVVALAIDLLLGAAQLRLRGYLGASLVLIGMAVSAWRLRGQPEADSGTAP